MANPTEDNKALVLAGITGVFIDRDPTVLDRLFSDDYKQHNPQIPNGTAAIYHRISNISPALWRPMATIAEVPSYRVRM
jgi:predicted SnoaL-like aldol condensation-catalyzing enzyme